MKCCPLFLLPFLLLSSLNTDAHFFCDRVFHFFPKQKPLETDLKTELNKPVVEVSAGVKIRYPQRGSVFYGDGIMVPLPDQPLSEVEQIDYSSKHEPGHNLFVLFLNAHLKLPQKHEPSSVVYTHFIYWPSRVKSNFTLDTQIVKKIFQNLYGKKPLLTIKEVFKKQSLNLRDENTSSLNKQANALFFSQDDPQPISSSPETKNHQSPLPTDSPLDPFLCTGSSCKKKQLKTLIIKAL